MNTDFYTQQLQNIRVYFNLDNLILEIRHHGLTVFPGNIAVAIRSGNVYDRDGLPEVYIDGEIILNSRRETLTIALLRKYPGSISIEVNQHLSAISVSEQDNAVSMFSFLIRLEDPILLLDREAKWMETQGSATLLNNFKSTVQLQISAIFEDNLLLWRAADIREIAGNILGKLDQTLKAWGLRLDMPEPSTGMRLDDSMPMYRRFPKSLYEIALDFKAAERELTGTEGETRKMVSKGLTIDVDDMLEIESISKQYGRGAGLFLYAQHKKQDLHTIINWLNSDIISAPIAANFLSKLYLGDLNNKVDITRSEQVLLTSFRNIQLGVGEWANVDALPQPTEQHQQMSALLDVAAEESKRVYS